MTVAPDGKELQPAPLLLILSSLWMLPDDLLRAQACIQWFPRDHSICHQR